MTDSLSQSPLPGRIVPLRAQWTTAIVLCILAIPLALLAIHSEGLDFRAFHVAAKSVAAHLDPYADNRQFGEQFTDVADQNGISRWIYPPPALFFAAPLGWFGFATAKLLFGLVSVVSLVWVLLFLGRRYNAAPPWLALACVSLPVIACVQRGQVDLLILLCVVLAYRFCGRFWAGIPLGIAISIKIFPAALLLWWLLQRKFREATTAILFTLAISVLAVWRFGAASYIGFLHNLTTLHSQARTGPSAMMPHLADPMLSLNSGFVGSYNNPLILLDNLGIAVGFLLACAGIVWLHSQRVAPEVGFFATVLLSQFMNTALWTMGMVMYLPICLVAISRLRSKLAAILFVLPLYLPSQIRIFAITPRFVIALALIGWLVVRSGRQENGTTYAGDWTSVAK